MQATLHSPSGSVSLGSTPLTIGSAPENQVVLNDPSVAPRHAEIRPEEQGYSITDLGSASGTFLNEERLEPGMPRLLFSGQSIRIGNTRFSYEAMNGSQIEPTVFASSPAMAGPPGGYGSDGQPGVYAPPPPGASLPSYMVTPAQPAQKPRRRGLWIILGSIIGVLVIGAAIAVALVVINLPTPAKVLTAYCNDLKAGNYKAAYNQYDSVVQKSYSEAEFTTQFNVLGKPTGCTVGNADSQNRASVTLTFANGATLINNDQVASNKINFQQGHPTPSFTLALYCYSLKNGDYQGAYSLLSSSIQSQVSESQFASSFGSNQFTDCTLSKLNNAAGSGTITATNSKGTVQSLDLGLVQESGMWKISSFANTPSEALNGFCSALTHQDYATAYSDLSNGAQSSVGSADQFASSFSSNKVTNCTASNVDDTTGKGALALTYADNSTQNFNATLIKQSNEWFIDNLQQA